jgi:hypothetical protein
MRSTWEAGDSEIRGRPHLGWSIDILEHHRGTPLPEGVEQVLSGIVAQAEARYRA